MEEIARQIAEQLEIMNERLHKMQQEMIHYEQINQLNDLIRISHKRMEDITNSISNISAAIDEKKLS